MKHGKAKFSSTPPLWCWALWALAITGIGGALHAEPYLAAGIVALTGAAVVSFMQWHYAATVEPARALAREILMGTVDAPEKIKTMAERVRGWDYI